MSKGFTRFLGLAEMAGALVVAFGVLTQLATLGLILVMAGAIYQKIYVWHTGFWGKDGLGWNYDLLFVVMTLVILFTGGGRYVLFRRRKFGQISRGGKNIRYRQPGAEVQSPFVQLQLDGVQSCVAVSGFSWRKLRGKGQEREKA